MKLGTLNMDKVLEGYLPKSYNVISLEGTSDFPEVDAVFIDWSKGKKNRPRMARQAAVVDRYVKKKLPVMIFDRLLSITQREYNWLKKFNVRFFEPALNYRRNFDYLPIWTETYDLYSYPEINIDAKDIHLGCHDYLDNKLKAFEKYYVQFGKLYPNWRIHYVMPIPNEKKEEYRDLNVEYLTYDWQRMRTFILIGTNKAYEIGYLNPDTFDYMKMGCVPLLPQEHRYFHGLFSEVIIEKPGDINYFLSGYDVMAIPTIVEIYSRVNTYYPEMKVNHTVDVIQRCLE
jgi:hypothetical protein